MNRTYDYFKYKLPEKSSAEYAANAVAILKDLKKQFPKQYKESFRCPSEVLTISGVRAFDTYYELGKNAETSLKKDLEQYFNSVGMFYVDDTYEILNEPNPNNSFSLVHINALADLPNRYSHIPGWIPLDTKKLSDSKDLCLWWASWHARILLDGKDEEEKMLKIWLNNDLYAAHNIVFGMVLGYPGEAICSTLWETEADAKNVVEAKIRHAKKNDGAWPIYSYLKELENNHNIIAHQKLWSEILGIVYAALPN